MARNHRVLWNWDRFGRAVRVDGEPRIWSRFPVELGPGLIVSPHLFDWPAAAARSGRGAREVYTCASPPDVVVLSAVSDEHRVFLEQEVVPRVHEHVRFVALVDYAADEVDFAPLGGRRLPAEQLAPLLRIAWGRERMGENAFEDLGAAPEPGIEQHLFGRGHREAPGARPGWASASGAPRDVDVAKLEAHPLRLWEALFWRGHTYRYELIGGETPLVADLLSPLAANRTLMQLVRDAERLEGAGATEHEGWIGCGRFRMRQRDRIVEVRAKLSPADVRAAFMPQLSVPGDDDLPSVLGALMAGGDNGKTELWNGFTWSTFDAGSPSRARDAAHVLAPVLERWTDTRATVEEKSFKLPDEPREEWFLVPHKRWLTIYAPFGRHDCLPWQVHAGDFQQRDEGEPNA